MFKKVSTVILATITAITLTACSASSAPEKLPPKTYTMTDNETSPSVTDWAYEAIQSDWEQLEIVDFINTGDALLANINECMVSVSRTLLEGHVSSGPEHDSQSYLYENISAAEGTLVNTEKVSIKSNDTEDGLEFYKVDAKLHGSDTVNYTSLARALYNNSEKTTILSFSYDCPEPDTYNSELVEEIVPEKLYLQKLSSDSSINQEESVE